MQIRSIYSGRTQTFMDKHGQAETGEQYFPNTYDPGVKAKKQKLKWYDVDIDYVTSGAIYRNGDIGGKLIC